MKLLILFVFLILVTSCREEILEFTEHPETGKLYFNSTPKGAEIFLNDNRLWKYTPDSLLDIKAGVYSVKLRLIGYPEERVLINVRAGKKNFVNVNFSNF
jgi:hypothetical protein